MINKISNRLRLVLNYRFDAPIHMLVSYITLLAVGLAISAILFLSFLNLRLLLYSLFVGTLYINALISVDVIITIILITSLMRPLSQSRKWRSTHSTSDNLKIEIRTPTYIQFLWVIVITTPLAALFVGSLPQAKQYLYLTYNGDPMSLVYLTLSLLFLFLCVGWHQTVPEKLRFAPGTTNDDEFGYSDAAVKDMDRIVSSDEHMLIANINGRLGEGKSSYLRMMIESRNQSELLYTFISLTETNETKSFSKLFAERWSDTITSRYPSIVSTAKHSVIDNILREAVSGLMKAAYVLMSIGRWPLMRTKVTAHGDNYGDEKFTNDTVASLFAYVPHFKERYWVIVIDEIERARFDEIYRVVETVERFRIESQWGLPLKLIFILCTDRIKFRERVKSPIGHPPESAELAHSFFEKEPKTIDMHIDLPPIAPDKKEAFIIKREREWLIDKYRINVDAIENPDTHEQGDLRLYWLSDMINASDFEKGRLDDKKAHDLMLHYLLGESPRFIKKVLEETERFLGIFTKAKRSQNQIRISDLIMLHYLKFKYPEALEFLYKIHAEVFPDFYSSENRGSTYSLMRYLLSRKAAEDMSFSKFFEMRIGREYPEPDVRAIEGIVAFLCYPVIQYVSSLTKEDSDVDYEEAGKPNYDRTLGLPENMWDALTVATSNLEDSSIYLRTQKDKIFVLEHNRLPTHLARNGTKLLNFARNMRRYYSEDVMVSRILASRIAKVLSTKRLIPRFPGSLSSETPYQNLLYVFTFHLANYISGDDTPQDYVDEAFALLKSVLTSSDTMLEGKMIIINSMFVYSRSNQMGSIDLDRARKAMEASHGSELAEIIREVMDHGLDIYLKERSIYDFEENYMYALYQMWSGQPTDHVGINKIRRAAINGLVTHKEVIGQYWENRFQTKDNFITNAELPIELEQLIAITVSAGLEARYRKYIDYWKNELGGKIEPISPAGERDGFTTLRMQLTKLDYLG